MVTAVNDAPVAVNDSATTAEETPVSGSVLTNDTDVDGATTLTASLVANAPNGSVTLASDGSFTYTPAANFAGSDSFTYTASDGTAVSNVATVTVTVTGVNDAPVAVDDSATTAEETPVSGSVLTNDTDVDGATTLTATLVSSPANGIVTLGSDGSFTYTPAANFHGPASFTYTASDGTAVSNVATVTVTVTAVNDGPVAVNDTTTTPEDTAVTIAVLSNDSDVDGDPLAVTRIVGPPFGSAVINPDGTITYTPAPNYSGGDILIYTVSDGHGANATATVIVMITGVNDAPVAVDDAASTLEERAVSGTVLGNDTDADDGATLAATLVSSPANGIVTLASDGSFTYTPAANFHGTDSFAYTASDGRALSNAATVTITVTAVNDAPVAVNDTATTAEDTAVSVAVLPNDSDLDGDTVTVASAGTAAHGTAAVNPDGTITYAPAANYHGADTFSYTVGDGHGGTATATVSVTVTPTNDGPVAVDDAATTTEDTAVSIAVLTNDTDLDGDALTVSGATAPAHGTATVNAGGTITYAPAGNYHGADSFSYTVGDGHGGSTTATVAVTVTPTNDGPVAVDDAATTTEDTAVSIAVLPNDTDLDGDALTVSAATAPAHGTALVNAEGTITYAPAANYHGADSFSYTVGDGNGGSATATVSVTVTPTNDGPVAVDDAATTAEDTAVTVAVLPNDTDLDGDAVTVTSLGTAAHGAALVNANGTITYTPAANYHGADSFSYTIGDGNGGSATATVDGDGHADERRPGGGR